MIYDTMTGQILAEFTEHPGGVFAVLWSLDGRRLVSGSNDSIRIWDMEKFQEIGIIDTLGEIDGMALSPDGDQLIVVYGYDYILGGPEGTPVPAKDLLFRINLAGMLE